MGSGQGEPGLCVVESRREPGGGGVAYAAIGTELTLMSIILGVARVTVGRQGGENVVQVTLVTGNTGVSTGERELRLSMVE
jgi:hypothetical protein